MARRRQHPRPDQLARQRQLPGPLGPEQQLRARRGHRDQRGPPEHPAEGARVLRLRLRLRCDRVDRPAQGRIGDRPQVDVEQVVDLDPGQPPGAVAERPAQAGLEQRVKQAQHAAARGLHDAGPDLDGPDPGGRGRPGRVLPGGDHVGQEPVAPLARLGQDLVAAVGAVEAHRGRGDEGAQPPGGPGRERGQRAGRADPARPDRPLALRREPAANRRARQVDHRVDAVEQPRVGVVRPPLALAVVRAADGGPAGSPGARRWTAAPPGPTRPPRSTRSARPSAAPGRPQGPARARPGRPPAAGAGTRTSAAAPGPGSACRRCQ